MSIYIKGNVHGDVIEAGGVKNVTNNYYDQTYQETDDPKQESSATSGATDTQAPSPDEKLCIFIHPAVNSDHEWAIHNEIKRLVKRQRIQDICQHLQQMSADNKILLPISPQAAYTELVRMGMPDGEGFSPKAFQKYYKK